MTAATSSGVPGRRRRALPVALLDRGITLAIAFAQPLVSTMPDSRVDAYFRAEHTRERHGQRVERPFGRRVGHARSHAVLARYRRHVDDGALPALFHRRRAGAHHLVGADDVDE